MLCKRPFVRDPSGHVWSWYKATKGTPLAPGREDVLRGVFFGCGQCLPCRINRRRVWTLRLLLEHFDHVASSFVTLTYDDAHMPLSESGRPTLSKRDCQLFLKRLRKAFEPRKIRYYLAGEYGDRYERPHYHAIIFGLGPDDLDPCWMQYRGRSGKSLRRDSPLSRAWPAGLVHVGECQRESIGYVAGYCLKKLGTGAPGASDDRRQPFSLMSRKPALGTGNLLAVAEVIRKHNLKSSRQLRVDGKKWPIGATLTKKLKELGVLDDGMPDLCERMEKLYTESVEAGAVDHFFEYIVRKFEPHIIKLERRHKMFDVRDMEGTQ